MATSKLIQWLPEIVQATDEDIARFGPNAARVRALLNFLPTLSYNALRAAAVARYGMPGNIRGTVERNAILAAGDFAFDAGKWEKFNAARQDANDAAVNLVEYVRNAALQDTALDVAKNAAGIETVSDLIDPQTYRILTEPLNAGRVYDLRAREGGSEFMRLTRELRPISADDIERIADLSVDPRAQGIIEFLQGLQGGMPLAAKIDAARRLDRASRAGRRMQ